MRIHLEPSQELRAMARVAFPNYRGRTYQIDASGTVDVRSYWSGGSRDTFVAVNLATRRTLAVPQNGTPFDGGPIALDGVAIPEGYVIIEHSISCGRDVGITFHVHPNAAAQFLPLPVDVTDDQLAVLRYTAQLKNTYAGETDIRYREAARDTGITRERWTIAQAELRERRMLNAANAITPSGRNAAQPIH
jgi:hypothetical protein